EPRVPELLGTECLGRRIRGCDSIGNGPLSLKEPWGLDFQLTAEQHRLRNKCRKLATDFATRAAAHDRDSSHPVENYDRLREEEFLALTVGEEWGGLGASFLDHTLAYEVLAQGA